jgi:uroporphyrinogen-III synthase
MEKEAKVKTILVSQTKPESGKSIFDDIAAKLKLKVDYRSFIQVDPIPGKDLRRKKLNILSHTAIIFNAKNAVDHFFRVVEELRIELPIDLKYFCMNEGIGLYIQKYTVMRKRKVFFPKTNLESDFFNLILNHKTEKFLFPCSDIRKSTIPDFFEKNKLQFVESIMYKTVSADLSDLEDVFYDIIVFFSPADIKSLYENFPDFKQNKTRLAAFGESTHRAIAEKGLVINIPAPTKEFPSIVSAMEAYIKKVNS